MSKDTMEARAYRQALDRQSDALEKLTRSVVLLSKSVASLTKTAQDFYILARESVSSDQEEQSGSPKKSS